MAQVASDTGAEVTFDSADVASGERVRAVMGAAAASGELRGVMHCAGITDPAPIGRQDSERLRRVFAPKVGGSWNLHEVASGPGVNMFVLFSSISSFLGVFGQANYAAANAFMDGLARMRTHNGQAGLSVSWGPWAEVGMVMQSSSAVTTNLKQTGVGLLAPAVGVECLEAVVFTARHTVGASSVCVADIEWSSYLSRMARPQAVLARMVRDVEVWRAKQQQQQQQQQQPKEKTRSALAAAL
jgi:hypothetical protein